MSRNAPATLDKRIGTALCSYALLCALITLNLAAKASELSSSRPSRARVVVVQDPEATDAFRPNFERVQAMLDRGIQTLTGKPTTSAAWLSLVTVQDIVGIKVYSLPGPNSGTRPAVAEAVARGLLAAGLRPQQIVVWDKFEADLRDAGYFELAEKLGIRVEGSVSSGFDPTNFYDTPLIGTLVWDDFEFGKTGEGVGRKSFVAKLVSQKLTKIINVSPLLNHNLAGVSGNLFGLALGSVDNTYRFEQDAVRLAKAVPELYALPAVGDKVVLNITDALICQYEGGRRGLLHYSTVLNQVRLSRDPVALDLLSIKELDRQRRLTHAPYVKPNFDLYYNANLLELGVNDVTRVQVETLK